MPSSDTTSPRMIVGLPTKESRLFLQQLTSGGPIGAIDPPIFFLSSPKEKLSDTSPFWDDSYSEIRNVGPYNFRTVYNSTTKITEMDLLIGNEFSDYESIVNFDRSRFHLKQIDPGFIPYFPLFLDPYRTSAARRFCISVGNALSKPDYNVEIEIFGSSNPNLLKSYNPNVMTYTDQTF